MTGGWGMRAARMNESGDKSLPVGTRSVPNEGASLCGLARAADEGSR